MTPHRFSPHWSATEFAALMDVAKLRAVELRNEAVRDFWSTVRKRIRGTWGRLRGRLRSPPLHAPS